MSFIIKDKFYIDAINKMMQIAGYNIEYKELLNKKNWFDHYSITQTQSEDFEKWYKLRLHEDNKIMHQRVRNLNFEIFNLTFGLKVKENEKNKM